MLTGDCDEAFRAGFDVHPENHLLPSKFIVSGEVTHGIPTSMGKKEKPLIS